MYLFIISGCLLTCILLEIIDMNGFNKIRLNFDIEHKMLYCTFSSKGDFILYGEFYFDTYDYKNIIWVFSTQTKNNKWMCKKVYMVPDDFKPLHHISKHDKFYLFSNNYIYEWNILTGESIRSIFVNENEVVNYIKIIRFKTMYN